VSGVRSFRRNEFRASKILQERVRSHPKVELVLDSVVEDISGSDIVETVRIRNLKTQALRTVEATGVFIFVGFTPNSGLVKDPIEKDALGYVLTDQNMATSIPGMFAIGDLRKQLTKQITNAVGDGTTAAVAAEKHIEGTLRPNPGLAARAGVA